MPSWSDPYTGSLNSFTTYVGAFSVVSNQVTSTNTGAYSIGGYLSGNLGGDHFAQLKITALDAANSRSIGPATRMAGAGVNGSNYQLTLDASSGGSWTFSKFVNFSSQINIDQQSITISLPMVLRLESIGATHRVLIDGVLKGTYQDTDVPAGTANLYSGLYSVDGNNVVTADDFYAETIYVPPRVIGGYRATI